MTQPTLRRAAAKLLSVSIGIDRPTVHALTLVRGVALAVAVVAATPQAAAQALVDPTLSLRVAANNLGAVTGMAFIGPSDALVLEKQTGQVKRVDLKTGAALKVVLDLSVNNFSERGLLGIALHPDFPNTPKVYLYHTERTSVDYPAGGGPNGLVPSYVGDTGTALATPLLGNRLDQFTWSPANNGSLTFDKNNAGGGPIGLQQRRYLADNIANSPGDASSRLYMLPGAHYGDPMFSWKHIISPAGIGFVKGQALGKQYDGDLIVGTAVDRDLTGMQEGTDPAVRNASHGELFRFRLTGNRQKIAVDDPALEDRVADNLAHEDYFTEQSTILLGTNFGIVTDIQTGPNGHLYVLSLTRGNLYEISKR
ncbi:MAG: PQQ-dependent sugar dehydrogenase [Burkholderiaceae bacterium]